MPKRRQDEDDDVKVIKGRVLFDQDEELGDVEASDRDVKALVGAVKKYWDRYLHMDGEGLGSILDSDVIRMSQRSREHQRGAAAVVAGMKKEWEAFERPENLIAEEMTLRWMEISVDDEEEASAATITYFVEIEGGARWHYEDQGFVLQAFRKEGASWRLVHQIDVWSTDYDLDEEEPGEEATFVFDYVYPVNDLARAVKFYSALLGPPDAVSDGRAYFGLRGVKFILDSSSLGGFAQVRQGLPSGYAVMHVASLEEEMKKLAARKVKVLAGADGSLVRGGDRMVLIEDVAGNVLALAQREMGSSNGSTSLAGLEGDDPHVKAAREIAAAWLGMDARTIARYHGDEGSWLDDTRTSARGLESGAKAISQALEKVYWPRYDRGSAGVCAAMVASSVSVKQVGEQVVVSYVRSLTGTGSHPFRERAFVTHVFDDTKTVAYTVIAAATSNEGLVIELDYTGHPVPDLDEAERFYSKTMQLGDPYEDDEWRGWWSNNAVYGAFTSDPDEDGLPQRGKSNGYVSFWVRSAEKTHEYLKGQGVSFPLIASISEKTGVDRYPGYTQVVSTDSEGNLLAFTEYTGKKR